MLSPRVPLRLLSVLATAALTAAATGSNSSVQWAACANNLSSSLPVDCGRLTVPLDYTQPESESGLELDLFRVPAVVQPAQGSILLNFGGPGQPARQILAVLSPVLQALSGGRFNLVAFDPRGTVNTLPFTCHDAVYWQSTFWQDAVFPIRDDPRGPDTDLGRLWARASALADVCARKHNDTGRLISTAFVARDLVRVAEAIDGDGLVRYWGFSYGTTLGATLVSMFPNKVDKLLAISTYWPLSPFPLPLLPSDFEEWTQSDDVLSGIFTACAANPDRCALARPGKSGAELEQSVWKLVDSLRLRPLSFKTSSFILDDVGLRGLLADSIYSTSSWPNVTAILDMLISRRVDEAFVLGHLGDRASLPQDSNSSVTEAAMARTFSATMPLFGIHCLDRGARAGSFDALLPAFRRLLAISRVMGGAGANTAAVCAQWKLEPRERYAGDFRARPRAPVLIVGNSHDGHTPIRSAHNVSAGLEGSVVLEVDGYGVRILRFSLFASVSLSFSILLHLPSLSLSLSPSLSLSLSSSLQLPPHSASPPSLHDADSQLQHTSLGLPSTCMLRAVSAYWQDGKMPAPGTICRVDAPPFSAVSWLDVFNNGTAGRHRALLRRHAGKHTVVPRPWRFL
ncbi:hypothetical protein XA68_15959 [Ophiocordyceps unilateralis]|uniref:AB hydrolase-1 domain-containing protein n=1 Tax=Ophiocordyceps unilateralis TaxID=268505 RepID=A0A2A9P5V4_OPHUN|nr:hypothetical protein XA68_15959 [Ophiocordyceps unilateralis]